MKCKMVDISIDLVRKRSEHNEGEISTLEELSLHQEDIVKIDHLQNWCRDLKILLLQSNLISRIENVWKFKKLEYLNLALNNIEIIENLEGCESLRKLDLTLNFIGELTSVHKLRANIHLDTLYLTGNPCCDYTSYRNYVIATLPQLKYFDNVEIERSDRIQAMQAIKEATEDIKIDEDMYKEKRKKEQKAKAAKGVIQLNENDLEDAEKTREFWESQCDNSPETRIELARQSRLQREAANRCRENAKGDKGSEGTSVDLFWPDGRARNLNQARLDFVMEEDEEKNAIVLDVAVYRFLDTSLVDVDVEPTYVRVAVKKKILQLCLPAEVHPDQSTAERSQTTGNLVITMPMVKDSGTSNKYTLLRRRGRPPAGNPIKAPEAPSSKRELLEIGPADPNMDFSRILEMARADKVTKSSAQTSVRRKPYVRVTEKPPSNEFREDPQVPSLE